LAVRYWPGQPAPPWINTWTDRLWVLLCITFLAGSVLSFYNMSSTVLPNGGYRYSASRPLLIQYALLAFYIPLVILALVGAGYVVREAAGAVSLAGVNLLKLGASLAVAAGALAVGLALGGPLTITTSEGVSSIWPFVIEIVAGVVFFTALASAWSATRASPARH
jgi:hypothetical protein